MKDKINGKLERNSEKCKMIQSTVLKIIKCWSSFIVILRVERVLFKSDIFLMLLAKTIFPVIVYFSMFTHSDVFLQRPGESFRNIREQDEVFLDVETPQ